ncbi:MAG: YceI family protein [Hyphomicrobiales bacterium]
MTWQVDPTHTSIEFRAKHMMVSTVKGIFQSYNIDAEINEDDLTASKGTVEIDVASVNSGSKDRDDHLRSPDFFDAEKYPKMRFASRKIERTGDGEYRLVGDLTIRDVTKEVVLEGEAHGPFEDPWGAKRVALSAEGQINRKDWGLTWNVPLGLQGAVVGDTIKLSIDAELVKSA